MTAARWGGTVTPMPLGDVSRVLVGGKSHRPGVHSVAAPFASSTRESTGEALRMRFR